LQSPMDPAGPPAAGSKGNAWQTKTLAPAVDANAARTKAPTATIPPAAASAASANSNDNWRLVLYSYKYKQDAERRIVLLKRAHPTMDARLFVPVKKWPFMVVIGGPMSKDNADDLKKQAIAQGMPRAIYVQRF
jgi:eukaryotic-like serine/threonine-protein kinase